MAEWVDREAEQGRIPTTLFLQPRIEPDQPVAQLVRGEFHGPRASGQFFRVSAADRPGFLGAITPERSLTGDGSIAYFIRSSNTKLRAHVGNGFRAPSPSHRGPHYHSRL